MKRVFCEIVILTSIFLFYTGSLFAQVKIVCVGNSITEGWHGNPSYVPPLQKLLGTNYIVLNKGRSGATALKKGDVPYWTQSVFSQTLTSKADVITIMLGTNDTKSKNWDSYGSEFKSDYAALIDTLRSANKNAKIFPVLPTPVCIDNYGIRNVILKSVISIIKEEANEKGLTTIDVNTPLLSSCNCFADGVHPNADGADTLANVFYRSITQMANSSESKKIKSGSIFSLGDNFPNPFNKSTTIEYSLAKSTNTKIAIYNLAGNKIVTLVNNFQLEGTHKVVWDAPELSAGVYIYQLKTEDFIESKKMYLLNSKYYFFE